LITTCLFPVAGYGTRFLPATKSMPKEMLPIVNKPLIQYAVEEAIEAGMTSLGFITGRGKRSIEDHFDTNYELEHQIKGTSKEQHLTDIRTTIDKAKFIYIRQGEMRGLGHAVLTGEPIAGNDAFGVILADDLCAKPDENPLAHNVMAQLVHYYEKYQCSIIAIQEVPRENTGAYGIISGDEIEPGVFTVTDMVEKPAPEEAPSNLAVIGRYILTADIFSYLKETKAGSGNEIQLTDALKEMCNDKQVLAIKFKGIRFDCGSIEGFVSATNYHYERDFLENN